MKNLSKQQIIIGIGIILLVLIITGFILGKIKSVEKKKRLLDIDKIITENIGANGEDIDTLLFKVKPDASFNARPVVEALIKADGIFIDDEDIILNQLAGKSKAQFAKINQVMLQEQGKSLQTYLVGTLRQLVDMGADKSYPKYVKVFNMIKSAK